jgi:hypothetical protein
MAGNFGGSAIEKLVGRDNYPTWKIGIQALLDLDDLWTSTVEHEGDEPVDAAKDRKARNKLILSIDPTCYVHIQGAKTAKEIWNKLSEAFEDNGLFRQVGLLRKLNSIKLSECGSMEKYVTAIVSTAHSLNGIGFPISEKFVGA